jgi:hypothetical protein
MRIHRWGMIVLLVFGAAALASGSGAKDIGVTTLPAGASIIVDARSSGISPCNVSVKSGSFVFASLNGYEVAWTHVENLDNYNTNDKPLALTLRRTSGTYNQEWGILNAMRTAAGDNRLAMDWAIYESRLSALEYLASLGADFSGRGMEGSSSMTPLMLAISYERPDAVDWLLAHDAVAGLVTYTSPLEMAMEKGRSDIIIKLKAAGARADASMLFRSAAAGSAAVINRLVSSERLDINARDGSGRTALIIATMKSNKQVVAELIMLGADITLSDNSGYTALEYARDALQRKMEEKKSDADESWPETAIARMFVDAGKALLKTSSDKK